MQKVIIVGAGPVGMTAALSLAQMDIPSLILEAKPEWSPVGSRAIVTDKGSLTFFKEIGCFEEMLKRGLVALRRRTFLGNAELYVNDFPQVNLSNGEIPLFLNLPQSDTEGILLQKIHENPLIEILWGHKVTEVKRNDRFGVTLTVQNGAESEFETKFLIAADGCRSTVRKLCNMGFPGVTNPAHFLIVDIHAKLPHEKEHRFYFSHPTNPGRTLLVVPQPNDIWRIDWQLPGMNEAALLFEQRPEILKARIRQVIGNTPFELAWQSCYQFHQRLVPSMRSGNVFFAGDAAHLVNPFGARGMNSGIQDVAGLTWKIAAVLHGHATTDFLQTYCTERWAANFENQVITKQTMNFIAPTTFTGKVRRDLILMGSKHFPKFRQHVNSGKMSQSPVQERVIPEQYAL